MASKIINLDDLIPENATIVFKGVEHEVLPASTEMYLQVLKSRDKLKHSSTEIEQVEQSILMIRLSCPTISEKDLRAMPLRALQRFVAVVEELMSEVNEGDTAKKGEESLGE